MSNIWPYLHQKSILLKEDSLLILYYMFKIKLCFNPERMVTHFISFSLLLRNTLTNYNDIYSIYILQ